MLCILQRVVELSKLVIDDRQIVERDGISRVGLCIEFVGGNALVELTAVRIVMGHDVEFLALAGPIAKLESFLPVLLRQLGLLKVVVDRAEAGVGHREIRIDLNSVLIVGNSTQFVAHVVLGVSQAQRPQSFER